MDLNQLKMCPQQMDVNVLPHLLEAIRQGCSGTLVLRSGEEAPGMQNLENLFGTIPVETEVKGKGAEDRGSSLRNMNAVLASSSEGTRQFARKAGFSQTCHLWQLGIGADQHFTEAATTIARVLDFENLKLLEEPLPKMATENTDDIDLLLIDLGGLGTEEDGGALGQLRTVDKLLKELNNKRNFKDFVLLVILLRIWDEEGKALPKPGGGPIKEQFREELTQSYTGFVRPKQSFEFACLDKANISRQDYIYCAQRLPYVIREDQQMEIPFDLKEAHQSFGDGCILAERLLPSLAYKLNCAPKYGA